MATPIIMPKQGQSVETCIITEWFKKKGESVKVGDILFSYETDKASFEEEAKDEGTLLDVFFEDGDEVPVLINIAVLGKEGESVDEFRPDGQDTSSESVSEELVEEEKVEAEVSKELTAPVVGQIQSGEVKVSPRAKKTASKLHVPVNALQGTGPGGRVIERDVEAYAQSGASLTSLAQEVQKQDNLSAPVVGSGIGGRATSSDLTSAPSLAEGDAEIKKLSNMRKIIAKKMHESLQNSAQLTHHMSADARKMLEIRSKIKKLKETTDVPNITLNDMVCYAVIKALKVKPEANAHFLGDSIKMFKKVHLGIAVDTERGLMVPTLRNADDLSIQGLSSQLKALAMTCKQGSVDPELLASTSATFTVSNLGAFGVEMFTPVVNLPQAGILGVNTIVKRPADLGNGVVGFVPYIGLSLTYDHRILDGAPASAFLKEIKEQIENLEINF